MAEEGARPNLLMLTRNMPPLMGGMERLIWHMADEFNASHKVHVVGPKGAGRLAPNKVDVSEVPIAPLPWFLLRICAASLWQALRQQPKVVLAGSGLTAPVALLTARVTGARAVVYLHGLDIEARHYAYRKLWHPCIRRCDRIIANSRFTRQVALEAGIPSDRLDVLHPGVDLPDLSRAATARESFRARYNLGDAPVMLYVGRISARKGLAPFVRDILPSIVNAAPEVRLVVIGDEPHQAVLGGDSQLEQVHIALQANGLSDRMHHLGPRTHNDPEISDAYFAADVHVFPVQDRPGDNEGFGMVAVEAAAHGLPTVAFATGGTSDSVADGTSGTLVSSGDNTAFARAVADFLLAPAGDRQEAVLRFASSFAWTHFGRKLRELVGNAKPARHSDAELG